MLRTAPARQVDVDGAAVVLGEADVAEPDPRQLLSTVERLGHQQRWGSAKRRVQRFPDVTLRALQKFDGPIAGFMAQVYDEQLGLAEDGETTWHALIVERTASPDAYTEVRRVRSRVVETLEAGHFEQALTYASQWRDTTLSSPLVEMDRLYWHGLALLLNDRFDKAADTFAEGAVLAEDHHQLHQAARLHMLASHAHHREEAAESATARWEQAVVHGAVLLEGPTPLADPGLWEQAARWRPEDARWPARVQRILEAQVQGPLGWPAGEPVEATLWAAIAHWRDSRGEHDAAVIASRRTESMVESKVAQGSVRLAMGRMLSQAGERGAATSLLVGLTNHEHPEIAAAARGALGVMYVQRQQVREGARLIQRALEDPDWPGRAGAKADLGLAYLLLDEQAKGMELLRDARADFDARGKWEQAMRASANEAAYWDHVGDKANAETVRERITARESLHGQ